MDSFKWSDSYNLGIDLIDAQHKQIVVYIDTLNSAILNENIDKIYEVLDKMKDYTMDHFAFEEQLMEKAGYVLSDAHKQVHRRFEEKVADFEHQIRSGTDPLSVARKIRNALMTWLIQHIKHEDTDYVPVVKKYLNKETSWIGGALKKIFGTENA